VNHTGPARPIPGRTGGAMLVRGLVTPVGYALVTAQEFSSFNSSQRS
jgi:hypothetical protein